MTKHNRSRRSPLTDPRGFSLVEVVAAMAAGLVVVGAALQALVYFQREFVRQHEWMVQQQDARLGLELFEQELRLASPQSFSIVRPDIVEFTANVSGLATNMIGPAAAGQTTLSVDDGRGWPDNKPVNVCWNDQCQPFTLARAGQRNLLTLVEVVPRSIPAGALVMVMNRVRYYSRLDERGTLRWLRHIDGGASVLASPIAHFTLRYQDARGLPTTNPDAVQSVVVEIALPGRSMRDTRKVSLRT